ncbi:hypothetical protein O181_061866 [Austropuccinia psidii MF-1]|uniref:Uncharacterized protein n=1 Tax=Austropuccinia psidii MF-1 TaxID=1389203 RepID=A0A9Q3EGY8_9BASI|nr:hypothetical protein [Austropuccinia psidii MF-1]
MPTLTLELASASLPNPLQCLACLGTCTPLQMRLRHCPPSPPSQFLMLPHPRLIFSLRYNPYAPAGPSIYASKQPSPPSYASLHTPNPIPRLPSLRLWSAFPTCL